MNLYCVLSEQLHYTEPVLDYGQGPEFPYHIYEMVFAKSRGQARYLAWKKDRSYTGNMQDMPKFKTRLIASGLGLNDPSVIPGNPTIPWSVYKAIKI